MNLKSKAAWAGAPSAGILSIDCLHWGTARFGCPLGTHSFVTPRGHSATGPCLATGHGGVPKRKRKENGLPSYSRAAEAWGAAKAVCYSVISFQNSTFFAFWVPLTLPEAFPEWRRTDFCKVDWLPGELNMFIFSQHVTISILPVKHPFTVCLV